MSFNKKIVIVTILGCFALSGFAQSAENVVATQQNNNIVITYDLKGLKENQSTYVTLKFSTDQKNFFSLVNGLVGDVNKEIRTNGAKTVVWDVLSQFELLDGKLIFKVEIDNNRSAIINGIKSRIITVKKSNKNLEIKLGVTSLNDTRSFLPKNLQEANYIMDAYGKKYLISKITTNAGGTLYGGEINSLLLFKNKEEVIRVFVRKPPSNLRFVDKLSITSSDGLLIVNTLPFNIPK